MDNTNNTRNKNTSLRILQWNARSIRPKVGELQNLAHPYDIILLSETWLKPEQPLIKIPGFSLIRNDLTDQQGGGVAIAIKDTITYSTIPQLDTISPNLYLIGVHLSTPKGKIAIISLYKKPNILITLPEWNALLDFCSEDYATLIGGDFNCHSQVWGSDDSCSSGDNLSEALADSNFLSLNDGSPTRIYRPGESKSCVDLTIASSNIALQSSWQVLSDHMGSDHFPIATMINEAPKRFTNFTYKINRAKIDWKKFDDYLESNADQLDDFPADTPPQTKYETLITTIMDAINSSLPESKNKKNKNNPSQAQAHNTPPNPKTTKTKPNSRRTPPAPWWTPRCSHAVALRRLSTTRFRKNISMDHYVAMKRQTAATKLILREEKLKGWANFCNSLDRDTPIGLIWQKIKWFKNRNNYNPQQIPKQNEESTQRMRSFITEFCPQLDHDYTPPPPPTIPFQTNPFLQKKFSPNELKQALNSTKKNSSPGLDKIDYFIINKLPQNYKDSLLSLFNELLSAGQFPDSWRKFLIFLLPKSTPGKFRPIALASCFLKLCEKLISNRLIWWLETQDKFPITQFGFRMLRSCADNLAILSTEILTGFAANQYTACVFIDIKGAFDNVDPKTLYKDLARLGIPQKIANFIYFLLAYRQSYFVVQGELEGPYPMDKGTGQGSVLSPILFNLYLADLPSTDHLKAKCYSFADDVVLIARGSNLDACLKSVESAVNKISNYLTTKNLEISPEKSHLVIFAKKHFTPDNHSIKINGITKHAEETTKFLGVTLDYRFSLSPHINNLTKKGEKIISLIKSLRKTWFGADPRNLITFYRGLLRSSVEYGSHILRFANHNTFDKLNKLQYKALRLALGLRNSTPINVTLAEASEPPLKFRISQLADRYIMRTFSLSEHPLHDQLNTLEQILDRKKQKNIHNIRTDFPLFNSYKRLEQHKSKIHSHQHPSPYQFPFSLINCPPTINTTIGLTLREADNKDFALHKALEEHSLNTHTQIFTDGSKTQEGSYVGYAIFIPAKDQIIKHRISSYASIFTAEALAILTALQTIQKLDIEKSVILTDSLSTLTAMSNFSTNKTSSHIIFQIQDQWTRLSLEGKEVTFTWIPSHVGITGNEIVDSHAKDAIKSGELLNTPLPHSDFKGVHTRRMIARTTKSLRAASKRTGEYYFKYIFKGWNRPWYQKLKIDRPQITTITRMRSNHMNLNQSLHRKNLTHSPLCECGKIESAHHVFWFCPNYKKERTSLIKSLQKNQTTSLNLNKIILSPNAKTCYILHNFLKSINKQV